MNDIKITKKINNLDKNDSLTTEKSIENSIDYERTAEEARLIINEIFKSLDLEQPL